MASPVRDTHSAIEMEERAGLINHTGSPSRSIPSSSPSSTAGLDNLARSPTASSRMGSDEAEVTSEVTSIDAGEVFFSAPDLRTPESSGPHGLYMSDGVRRIDYVLSFSITDPNIEAERQRLRNEFEKNLEEEGLELERDWVDPRPVLGSKKTYFVRIHAPWEVLTRHAEISQVRMPIKSPAVPVPAQGVLQKVTACLERLLDPFRLPEEVEARFKPKKFTCPFNRERETMFDIKEPASFFRPHVRSRIAYSILLRNKFGHGATEFGIAKALALGMYDGAYPIHDGDYDDKAPDNDRKTLYEHWARFSCFLRYQPVDLIRDYFGSKIGFYFAWLGFYTWMLFPAAILGLVVFIYGIVTMWWENQVSDEICRDYFNETMCPLCDKFCGYWSLGESCQSAMASHLFDNPATVFFAIFMSLWSTMFLELWKRRRHALQYLWDLQTFRQEEERPRPQFEAQVIFQVRHTKRNWITQEDEPWLPFVYRIPRYMLSAVLVLFAVMFGVIMYRVALEVLTNFIALAVFTGRLIGRPGKYVYTLGYRQEECSPSGCLVELCMQLGITMAGSQLIANNLREIFLPKILVWLNFRWLIQAMAGKSEEERKKTGLSRWELDYLHVDIGPRGLFFEYLEMVIQFGFVSLFVAAFPLAPLLALINNILEIRLDAQKFVCSLRRPMVGRAADIGVWYYILEAISTISVCTNAFVIAFTSEFIPRLVYTRVYSPDGSLNGYLNFSLSYFEVKDFREENTPRNPLHLGNNVTFCRYRDLREPPWSEDPYEYSNAFWHVLAARLAFVVVFQNITFSLTRFLDLLIPDTSYDLQDAIKMEEQLVSRAILDFELQRTKQRQRHNRFRRQMTAPPDEDEQHSPTPPATPDHHVDSWEANLHKRVSGISPSRSQSFNPGRGQGRGQTSGTSSDYESTV
ncbi:PREDICTED: anoctamin-1-like [Branchiostoma belcheri]|uniref:Anoctamin n=1 Tax=Branchiostoma belcheri TaxID=7741 RepID=A0A6P5A4H4_BRABE|nr:PREDICTED: anoctamin-1-like [Branchiostoma belcheri]